MEKIQAAVCSGGTKERVQLPPQVSVEHVFALSADVVWKRLGRFGGIAEWQSLVSTCVTEERADGFYRVVVMKDHTAYVERLENYSQDDRSFRYSILQGPLSVTGYVCDFQIVSVSQGQSRLVWRSWYDTPSSVNASEVAKAIEDLYRNGLKGMSALLGTER